MDWKKITSHLYENIKPTSAIFQSSVDVTSARKKRFSNLYIEFKMNEFIYEDPFYGEQSSQSPFDTFIELLDIPFFQSVQHIHHLQNLEISHDPKDRIGHFSNSLDLTVPRMKFGKIENNEIEFEMEYCLTNSYSYGMMDGTIEDHLQSRGTVSQKIKIEELKFSLRDGKPISSILRFLNADIYDLENVHKNMNPTSSSDNYTQYIVPYKNIIPKPKKKWWQF